MDRLISRIFSRILPSSLVWKVDTREKKVYLTFDDGPIPDLTPQILEILAKYDARATFFCVGENVKKYPELYRQIKKNGHSTGNHSARHLKGVKSRFDDYMADIKEANRYIGSRLFRPPYGLITPRQARALSKEYSVVMWTVLTRDFDPKVTAAECLQKSLDGIAPGSIFVFHDNLKAREKVLYVLPRLLEYLAMEGYQAENLDSALNREG